MADVPMMGKSIAFGTIKIDDHYAVANLSDSYWGEMVMAYLACISFVDDQVGKVIKALNNSKYAEIMEEHKKWLPENNALPAGTSEWKGDRLDRRIKEWISTGSIPAWLR
ncbi:hypothetical protein ES708_34122 [subsurface metagenome]